MKKRTMSIVKSMAAGAAMGMLTGLAGTMMTDSKRDLKKKANKAIDTVSDIVDSVTGAMKQ